MNAEQLKGKWTHFKGDLKQKWGKFTDDDLQQIGGSFERSLWSNCPAPRIDVPPLLLGQHKGRTFQHDKRTANHT